MSGHCQVLHDRLLDDGDAPAGEAAHFNSLGSVGPRLCTADAALHVRLQHT
jgi:hypothetical protein